MAPPSIDFSLVSELSREHMELNRWHWDEVVPIHARSRFYNVDSFLSGKSSLLPVGIEELEDVKGKKMLHLQCHFGLDTLSWACHEAKATGADYSGEAIRLARKLATKAGSKRGSSSRPSMT